MEIKTKKIIAREGLIIIGTLFCVFMFFYIAGKIDSQKYSLEDFGKNYKIRLIETGQTYIIPAKNKEEIESRGDEAVEHDKNGKGQDYINKKYGNEIKTNKKKKLLNKASSVFWGLYFFSLFALYPGYLLIRFFVWAIRTLKQKEDL